MATFLFNSLFGLIFLTGTFVVNGSSDLKEKRDDDTCVDQPICATQPDICSSSDHGLALTLCPVTCGHCVPGCKDNPLVNCSNIVADVCSFDSAYLLCPVTCQLCDRAPHTHPCRDHVQHIACEDLPDPCGDTVGMITCPRHCGLCEDQTSALPVTTTPTTVTTVPTTTPFPVTTPIPATTPMPSTTATAATTPMAKISPLPATRLPSTALSLAVSGPCDVNPCQNGGSCLVTGSNMFTCACPHGFEGAFCDNQLTPPQNDHCAFNPCYNGGTCHLSGADFYCDCPPEFLGTVCENMATTIATTTTTQDPLPHKCPFNPCRNGGYCVAVGTDYDCFCPGGVTGLICDNVVSPPTEVADKCPFNPCSNGGYCASAGPDFKCYCPKTHTGKICDDLVSQTVAPTTSAPSTAVPAPTTVQACKIDLQILLDSSGSVGRRNFQTMTNFTKNLVLRLDSHHHDIKVGMAVFSSNVYPTFNMDSYSSVSSIATAIGQAQYHNGNTNTEEALEYVRLNSFTGNHGDRDQVPNVLIIIADGQSSHPRPSIGQAEELRRMGVKIIAVGVGNSVDISELNDIATDATHVFTVSDYDALKNVENDLLLMTCLASYKPVPIG